MLKQWAILIGVSAGLAVSAYAIAGGGEECASKQNRAEKAVPTADVPTAEKSAAQSQSVTTEPVKQDVAANCPGGQCEK